MEELENFKQTILKDYPRLSEEDVISFRCGDDLACFNNCCADVNIFLTPYDVLRLRRALKKRSAPFLKEHTIIPFDKNQSLPVPLLMMNESERKECPFVDTEKGCTVYVNRPWPCRMYPMGAASPNEEMEKSESKFYFLLQEDFCLGLKEDRKLTVKEWLEDQGIPPYEEFGELFKNLTLHPSFSTGFTPTAQQIDMYWTAMYDLDKFRRFIFESTFLDRFEFTPDDIEQLKTDEEALLRFGFRWLDMAFFKVDSIPVKKEVREQLSKQGGKA